MIPLDLDFTLSKYQELCEVIQRHYTTCTIYEYLTKYQPIHFEGTKKQKTKVTILRHDVDRKINNALRMAELEHQLGIQSSYYFRYPYTFEPKIIAEIQALGHEVGYHYETLRKAKGDVDIATALFEEELAAFRTICDVNTICMHGNVLSPYDNRDIWKTIEMDNYHLLGEASLSIENAMYFTDTGRKWDSNANIRDTLKNQASHSGISSTDELIGHLECSQYPLIYINAHPERWSAHISDWTKNIIKPQIFNVGKKLILVVRS